MYKVNYTKKAKENLEEIFGYISEDNQFYAAKVISSIKNTIDILKLFPYSWKNIDDNHNMIVESKYKFKIVYKVLNKTIYVVSIFKYKDLWM